MTRSRPNLLSCIYYIMISFFSAKDRPAAISLPPTAIVGNAQFKPLSLRNCLNRGLCSAIPIYDPSRSRSFNFSSIILLRPIGSSIPPLSEHTRRRITGTLLLPTTSDIASHVICTFATQHYIHSYTLSVFEILSFRVPATWSTHSTLDFFLSSFLSLSFSFFSFRFCRSLFPFRRLIAVPLFAFLWPLHSNLECMRSVRQAIPISCILANGDPVLVIELRFSSI